LLRLPVIIHILSVTVAVNCSKRMHPVSITDL